MGGEVDAHDQQLVDEGAVSKFDQDYIDDHSLDRLAEALSALNPDITQIADFGGGNGRFLDRLLQRFPRANGINFEVSGNLRALNTVGPRKAVVGESFISTNATERYDVVVMNWVLHHLVGHSIRSTLGLIQHAADAAHRTLKPGGILVVSENVLQSFLPGQISSTALYLITRSRLLRPITSRMRDGASVAGVGIYYMTEPFIHRILSRFEHLETSGGHDHDYGVKLKVLGITHVSEKTLIFRKHES